VAALAVALVGGSAVAAGAQVWDERTTLTFSEPVRIPGKTLAAGTYVFELAEPDSTPHVVQIRSEDTSQMIAMVPAIPTRRGEASANTVLQFNPTEEGAPAAIEAWFYPNSTHGHKLVYSDEEAREIATRTRTLVLTMDEGDGVYSGRLMLYDESGRKSAFTQDEATAREWEDSNRQRAARDAGADDDATE
jgi:hypothetical protein